MQGYSRILAYGSRGVMGSSDSAELVVTRYRTTAIEAYQRLKLPADMLSWASRPSRGIEVDGMPGILF